MKPFFTLALVASLSVPVQASADITRGCKAIWEVRAGATTRQFGQFEARGRCRGKAWANDCRRSARGYAQECFRDAWSKRWQRDYRSGRVTPSTCLARGDIRVRGYRVEDLKTEIERHACAFQRATPFVVQVVGKTWDGKRCGGEIFLSNYEIKDEMCGKF